MTATMHSSLSVTWGVYCEALIVAQYGASKVVSCVSLRWRCTQLTTRVPAPPEANKSWPREPAAYVQDLWMLCLSPVEIHRYQEPAESSQCCLRISASSKCQPFYANQLQLQRRSGTLGPHQNAELTSSTLSLMLHNSCRTSIHMLSHLTLKTLIQIKLYNGQHPSQIWVTKHCCLTDFTWRLSLGQLRNA